jgi:hypothetical protein
MGNYQQYMEVNLIIVKCFKTSRHSINIHQMKENRNKKSSK